MALRLKKWRNPSTLEVRVYVNGHDLRGKVWLEADAVGGCKVVCDDPTRLDRYEDFVVEALEDLGITVSASFTSVVKEAEW